MTRLQLTMFSCLVVGGLGWITTGTAVAQTPDQTGVVRVTDSPTAANGAPLIPDGITRANCQADGCPQNQCPQHAGQPCPQGCPHGCPHGHGWGHACGHGYWHDVCCAHCSLTAYRILDWFNPHGLGTKSPDHGWCPPAKRPIYRADVVYNKMYPDAWTGMPAADMPGAPRPPVVYMPTDTTQLGYYYQKVPYWTPQPGMIPPAPIPSQWHVSACQTGDCRHHPAGMIIGTAPKISPSQATSAPVVSEPAIPPAPDLITPPQSRTQRLERSAESPNLLPIQR